MANYWFPIAGAAIIAILTFGIPRLLAEYFPWQSLRAQRHARPTVTTKSYKERTVLITGANGAFGSRAAKIFAHRDVETLILVDVKDCGGVKGEIEAELSEVQKPVPNILVWQIDMMTFAGCRELGNMARGLKSLDHVLLTAGILSFSRRESPEGWETSERTLRSQCPLYSFKRQIANAAATSYPSKLPLHGAHRPPPPPTPQPLARKPQSPRPNLRHNLRRTPCLLHHVRPQDRLLPQAPQQQ